MPKITITITDDYTGDLRKRLKAYGITHGKLAREMEIGEQQLSRWFNKTLQPRYENIVKIEKAVAKIRARMERETSKA